jgi:hypothetical protein
MAMKAAMKTFLPIFLPDVLVAMVVTDSLLCTQLTNAGFNCYTGGSGLL